LKDERTVRIDGFIVLERFDIYGNRWIVCSNRYGIDEMIGGDIL
jgi:hypothetical protein